MMDNFYKATVVGRKLGVAGGPRAGNYLLTISRTADDYIENKSQCVVNYKIKSGSANPRAIRVTSTKLQMDANMIPGPTTPTRILSVDVVRNGAAETLGVNIADIALVATIGSTCYMLLDVGGKSVRYQMVLGIDAFIASLTDSTEADALDLFYPVTVIKTASGPLGIKPGNYMFTRNRTSSFRPEEGTKTYLRYRLKSGEDINPNGIVIDKTFGQTLAAANVVSEIPVISAPNDWNIKVPVLSDGVVSDVAIDTNNVSYIEADGELGVMVLDTGGKTIKHQLTLSAADFLISLTSNSYMLSFTSPYGSKLDGVLITNNYTDETGANVATAIPLYVLISAANIGKAVVELKATSPTATFKAFVGNKAGKVAGGGAGTFAAIVAAGYNFDSHELHYLFVEVKSGDGAKKLIYRITVEGGEPDVVAPIPVFSPLDGAIDVAVDVKPTITFLEPMYTDAGVRIDNTNAASVLTFTDGTDPVAFTAAEASNILTITPAADLAVATEHVLTIAAVQDEMENKMAAPVTVKFTTVAV